MTVRHASINDLSITEQERRLYWPLGRRPDDHPGLSELGLYASRPTKPRPAARLNDLPSPSFAKFAYRSHPGRNRASSSHFSSFLSKDIAQKAALLEGNGRNGTLWRSS
jgi:hypothetical protein